MASEVITREDLEDFRALLLKDFKTLLFDKQTTQKKEWLKSYEVKKLLKISPGTLQNLRLNGTLSYHKIGSIMLYSSQDIDKLLDANRINNSKNS